MSAASAAKRDVFEVERRGRISRTEEDQMAEEWHDADEVVEAQEGTEDEAATRAAEHGKADAEGVLEQSGDAGLQGTREGAAWTPGSEEGR
jgi:hypothetical protein